jgi:hypothetical protein
MKTTALVFIVLLGITIPSGIISAAETTPIYPGMGGAPVEHLTNMYPTVKGNAAIIGYFGECGVGTWYEEQVDADFKSVHLTPANSCGKQLVFLARKSAGRDDLTRIAGIWIIGANETWSNSMDTTFPDGGLSSVPRLATGTGKAPGFTVPEVLIALLLVLSLPLSCAGLCDLFE